MSETTLRKKIAQNEIKPEYISVKEAAKMLGVAAVTLRSWRYRGWGPRPWRIGSLRLKYTRQEIQHYLERVSENDPGRYIQQRWDPKTFKLLAEVAAEEAELESAAVSTAALHADVAESQAEAEVDPELLEQYRAAGIIDTDS
jgi:predicted DNA-binding transcriptional regulator AlpA